MQFNNLKVGYRLTIAFAISLVLLGISVVVGSWGLSKQSKLSQMAYELEVPFAQLAAKAHIKALELRRYEKDTFINIANPEKTASYVGKWEKAMSSLEDEIRQLKALSHEEEVTDQLNQMESAAGTYKSGFLSVYGMIQSGKITTTQEGNNAIKEYKAPIRELFNITDALAEHAVENIEKLEHEILVTQRQFQMELWGTGGVAVVLVVLLGWFLTRSITKPLDATVEMLKNLNIGRFEHRLKMDRKDEIGQLANTMDDFADSLTNEVVVNLDKLAAGDLNFNVTPYDKDDNLRVALQRLQNDLSEVITDIQTSANEVNGSAAQVASSSEHLSDGTTQQASAIEEISASIHELSGQTTQNAENAATANQLASDVRSAADRGSGQMSQMVDAMQEINEAGQSISHIIKTIDEIAFQTNLLALNAAVEAARAGQHGKGFAVVAEEVRNLAARSAKAASETAELIEGSVQKGENGTKIAERTAEALNDIVDGIGKTSDLIGEIATSSHEQAEGINQINQGISQIDSVTQSNTSNAEESAAAAEELSGQAVGLRQALDRFNLKGSQPDSQVYSTPQGSPLQLVG